MAPPPSTVAFASPSEDTPRQRAKAARHAAYRELVLQAASEAFARDGVPQTKMEDLASEAGLSLGTVYSLYQGKAEIVDALHEERLREIHAASVAAEQAATDPLGALLAGCRAYLTYFAEHPDYLRLYLEEGTSWGLRQSMDRAPRRARVWNDGVAQLAAIVARGIEAGVFAAGDPDRMVRGMLALQQVLIADWEENGRRESIDALMDEVESLVRRLFGAPSA